jgi:hypothetical protein
MAFASFAFLCASLWLMVFVFFVAHVAGNEMASPDG